MATFHSSSRPPQLPTSPHNCPGFLALWAPESRKGLQTLHLDLPEFHGNETMLTDGQGWPELEKEVFYLKIFSLWVLIPSLPLLVV